jgi:outer membrane protein TolC
MRSLAVAIAVTGAFVSANTAGAQAPTPAMPPPAARPACPQPTAEAPLRLTLAEAIERGLAHNLSAVLAGEDVRAADGARWLALGGTLPSLSAGLQASRQKISLEQYGFPVAPGESPLLGPFNVVLGDVAFSQALLDFGAIQRARAGGQRLRAARYNLRDKRHLVVTTCAALYLETVAAASRVAAARAQTTTAEALAERARDMKAAGTLAGIEVLRADVQLASERQRLIRAENGLDRRRLQLARAIGLPLARPFVLVDDVPYARLETLGPEQALAQALATRPDLHSAEALLRAAESDERAALGRALPSLHVEGSLVEVGPTADSLKLTYSLAGAVRIPLFEGGRAQGEIAKARAALGQQRARVADLRAGIELDVRMALLNLEAADDEVQVARDGRALAERQLAEARDRFSAGVSSNIEVVQAQAALAEAAESYISSLLAHNLAKLALARAMGVAESQAGRYLEGER